MVEWPGEPISPAEGEQSREMAEEVDEPMTLQWDELLEEAGAEKAMEDQSKAASTMGDRMPMHGQAYVEVHAMWDGLDKQGESRVEERKQRMKICFRLDLIRHFSR